MADETGTAAEAAGCVQECRAPLGDVLVLGLGRTGEAAARYLAPRIGGRVGSVTVLGGAASGPGAAATALEALGCRVVLGADDVEGSFDLAVASPGIPPASPLFQAGLARARELVGEPELAFRESPERWLAITGTNGKTTSTSLATHLLRQAGLPAEAVGNIGVPPCARIDARPEGGWLVAELSSFQLATTRELAPRAAALLNVTPDHLEWHGSMGAYAAAKERVFANLGPDDLAVVVEGDDWCRAVAGRLCARGTRVCAVRTDGEPEGPDAAFVRAGALVVRLRGTEHELVGVGDLRILGAHNQLNALVASALALEAGAADGAVREGLASFAPIEHRVEPCGTAAGVRYVNDSKATNTDAVEKALVAFEPGRVVVMLGGHDKGTDLGSLARAVAGRCRVAVCYGEAGERLARAVEEAARELGAPCEVVRVGGATQAPAPGEEPAAPVFAAAFEAARAAARPGDAVLLSPACSSFDEFHNMGERGRRFKALVAALPGFGG